jgi:hypothetical protein
VLWDVRNPIRRTHAVLHEKCCTAPKPRRSTGGGLAPTPSPDGLSLCSRTYGGIDGTPSQRWQVSDMDIVDGVGHST